MPLFVVIELKLPEKSDLIDKVIRQSCTNESLQKLLTILSIKNNRYFGTRDVPR